MDYIWKIEHYFEFVIEAKFEDLGASGPIGTTKYGSFITTSILQETAPYPPFFYRLVFVNTHNYQIGMHAWLLSLLLRQSRRLWGWWMSQH